MIIYTTEKNSGVTIENLLGALTVGPSVTTLDTAVSSGKTILIVDRKILKPGGTIRISPGLGAEEDFILASVNEATPDMLTVFIDVANSHLVGATVQLEEHMPDESPDPDGFSRNNLLSEKLYQDYTLSAQLDCLSYVVNTDVTNPNVDDVAIFIKNFRSAPFTSATLQIVTSASATIFASYAGLGETQTIDVATFGHGYGLALSGRSAPLTTKFILAGLKGVRQNEPVEFAQIWLLNKHTLTSTWENEQPRQVLSGSTIHRHRSGIVDVISHSSEPRQRINGIFKNITTAEVDTLFTILRLSRGPFRPIIIDPLETRKPDELILARFLDDNALKTKRTDFDLWNATMELETLQLPDDL